MTENYDNQKVELVSVDLTPEEVEEKKFFLMGAELSKVDTDIQLNELEAQLDDCIPKGLIQDSIDELKSDIKNKKFRQKNQSGIENLKDATETEIKLQKIKLKSLEAMMKVDLPMNDLRYRIIQLKKQKNSIDAPEKQIVKLKREIRQRQAEVPATRVKPQIPVGVN